MTRKEANMEIIRLLVNHINMHPDSRFNQILIGLGVAELAPGRDPIHEKSNHILFYEEPEETLKRVLKAMSK